MIVWLMLALEITKALKSLYIDDQRKCFIYRHLRLITMRIYWLTK